MVVDGDREVRLRRADARLQRGGEVVATHGSPPQQAAPVRVIQPDEVHAAAGDGRQYVARVHPCLQLIQAQRVVAQNAAGYLVRLAPRAEALAYQLFEHTSKDGFITPGDNP